MASFLLFYFLQSLQPHRRGERNEFLIKSTYDNVTAQDSLFVDSIAIYYAVQTVKGWRMEAEAEKERQWKKEERKMKEIPGEWQSNSGEVMETKIQPRHWRIFDFDNSQEWRVRNNGDEEVVKEWMLKAEKILSTKVFILKVNRLSN